MNDPFKFTDNQPDWDNLYTDPLVGQEKNNNNKEGGGVSNEENFHCKPTRLTTNLNKL